MQHEGRGKAAKVDENVSQWTKICRSTVSFKGPWITMRKIGYHLPFIFKDCQRESKFCEIAYMHA